MSYLTKHRLTCLFGVASAVVASFCSGAEPLAVANGYTQAQTRAVAKQRKPAKKTQKPKQQPPTELDKLRDEYIKTTKELKASLEKLLTLYETSQSKAEARYAQSQKLFKDGLISKNQLEENERAITTEKNKVAGVKQQIAD